MCSQPPLLFLTPGRCASCGENVVGEGTGCTAMDQVFHVDCFVCMTCSTKLRGKPFYAVEKKAYCEPCYIVSYFFLFKPTCLTTQLWPSLVIYVSMFQVCTLGYQERAHRQPCAWNVLIFLLFLQATTYCFIWARRAATSHHTRLHFLFFFDLVLFSVSQWNYLSWCLLPKVTPWSYTSFNDCWRTKTWG